ncbi:MAG: hypothetical protein IJQ68_05480 [Methanobrevibacter sp.]|uniref:hypothetical protein n=1 Tax=Methanobrevibacter sp. TaxID=66852 RepID=UPI0025F94681|nr:hypothetical protein [Methanobrevibacter sp.]MBR0271428.1 hypothetical protein [Methanobrevibacter sp.]
MNRILQARNDILVEEVHEIPMDFGKTQAQKDLNQFEENLIELFNSDEEDLIFEQRTREALERVENRGIKGMTESQFLDELDSW